MKNKLIFLAVGILVIFTMALSYSRYQEKNNLNSDNVITENTPNINTNDASGEADSSETFCTDGSYCNSSSLVDYLNSTYGFSFTLPSSWLDYTVIDESWTGNIMTNKAASTVRGPQIIIRHPLWTEANPRQDIPVMVFTTEQWGLVQDEKITIGAAPITPSELGRNKEYVFAVPARYNFAFLPGFEEVESILESQSFVVVNK